MSDITITTVGSIVIALFSLISAITVTIKNNKKEEKISDRQLLSQDEKEFRAELRESISFYRVEIAGLKEEVRQLKEANHKLELENRRLVLKIEALTFQLQSMDHR